MPRNNTTLTRLPSAPSSRRRRRVTQSQRPNLSARNLQLHPDVRTYIRCLTDPFSSPPARLGFGCLTATQVATLTTRTVVAAGVDGQISAFVIPSINGSGAAGQGGLYCSNSAGGAVLASTQFPWQNVAAVANLFEEIRVISTAVRVYPMVPGTSSPGLAMVCSMPSTSFVQIDNSAKSSLLTNPLFEWGPASSGAMVTSRPVDPNSFTFHHNLVNGLPVTDDAPVTVPVIIMNGLPVSSAVFVEAVLQVEGIYGLGAQSQATQSAGAVNRTPPTMTTLFPSIESMWSTVSRYLPSPTTIRTVANLANTLLAPDLPRQTRYLPSTVTGRLMP